MVFSFFILEADGGDVVHASGGYQVHHFDVFSVAQVN
jgi:hypothetical protein